MNTDNAQGQIHSSLDALLANSQPGDWFIDEQGDYIWINIPGNGPIRWPINNNPLPNGSCWRWDGNREKPTIHPSLNLVDIWHGWMRAGELVSA